MWHEFIDRLSKWDATDAGIGVTAALAAMACALPGNFLLLRRQSLLGDALSHTTLLGIVLAFLTAIGLSDLGWVSADAHSASFRALQQFITFAGAVLVGVATAWLTEWIQRLGRVEASAALGVVFVSLFALALFCIGFFGRLRQVHLDVDCVLFGNLVQEITTLRIGGWNVSQAMLLNGGVLAVNLLLVAVFFKELRICAFDPHLATVQGIPARLVHYALMAATAVTIVAAFRSVGSILVIAMLITPAATARLLTDRLGRMLAISLLVAAASAVIGNLLADIVAPSVLARVGLPGLDEVSTTGMMALTAGGLFFAAALFAPRHGLAARLVHRTLLSLRIAGEDILGVLYRLEETHHAGEARLAPQFVQRARGLGPFATFLTLLGLRWSGKVVTAGNDLRLTDLGRQQAENLVRSHRLWETFLAARFGLPEDHVHAGAEQVEHYVGPEIREELQTELGDAAVDPHGKSIPRESSGGA